MNPIDAAEAELQQELREMFIVDTQQNLDAYFSPIPQLNPQSWTADIQQLYRSIHTIKGGAVTVAADAMLQVAIVLEDLLSDLRYLEIAPVLADGELQQILIEAGELLSSSIEITETGDRAIAQVQPTLTRLEFLRDRVKQLYLPEWNELKQVHQEFAEQGFDLVVLDLEMALTKLPSVGVVPAQTIETAQATIFQLTQIGVDIELAEDWTSLLQDCQQLITKPDCQLWTSVWFEYFELLKICVKHSGEMTAAERDRADKLTLIVKSVDLNSSLPATIALDLHESDLDLSGSLANFFLDEDTHLSPAITASSNDTSKDLIGSLDDFFIDEAKSLAPTIEVTNPTFDVATFSQNEYESIDSLDKILVTESLSSIVERESSAIDADFDREERTPFVVALNQDLTDVFEAFDEFFSDDSQQLDSAIESDISNISSLTISSVSVPADREISVDPIDDLSDLLDNFFDDFDELPSVNEDTSIAAVSLGRSVSKTELVEFPDLLLSEKVAEVSNLTALIPDLLPAEIASSDRQPIPSASATIDRLESVSAPAISSQSTSPEDATNTNPGTAVKRNIQISVPLERLDRSAQQIVETLLTARAVTSISTQLQSQLSQLTTLTRENSQFVTRLRQLQDDYALMRNLSDEQQSGNNVTLERYRQGYSTIVRLLENILRLSELGQEIESSTYQSAIRLDTLDRSILQLKDGIEASRLVPFRNLTLRAKAILRDLTNRYGKAAELIVTNEQIELDAGIVQQLEPALLHLLRNAYDHGLESIQQRLDAGKAAGGKILISIQQLGSLYVVTIEDDGSGIDRTRIHDLAKSKGFSINQTHTNTELLAVLCQPGFSSSSTVTEVSGRGVGMDVVVTQIASIGGRLSLETYPGLGTKFSIEIPAPQLLIPCVLFQVGDRTIALPTNSVLETALLSSMSSSSPDATVGMCTWQLIDARGEIPGFDLHNYWQTGINLSPRSLPDTAVCIRTRQAEDTPAVWSIADDLLGQAKLLINPLPSPLIAPVGLLGVSLQPDGKLISILDPIALSGLITSNSLRVADPGLAPSEPSSAPAKSSAPTILVVDDAAMIRRRFESSLNTYGFITHTCNDGLEALNWLQNNPLPDLMITDVEMPNMDGFTLIDRARQAKIEIPILVVSSRASEEWGKEARRLGASDYLNKGFATSELLQKVNSLLGLVSILLS